MNPVTVLEGRCAPLGRSDVDTDQIIPSEWLKRVERTGFGRGLFSEWRDDSSFILNQPEYAGASILIAGERFGVGSSREHAVWALMDYGFSAIIAPSFGDIFRNNASKSGLVIVQLDATDVAQLTSLITSDPARLVVVDVERLLVEVPDAAWRREFTLDTLTRERLVNGWDDIGLTLRRDDQITTYESTSRAPTVSVLAQGRPE